jgi:poly(3-hydroxybutyrate) depolymerase
VAEGRFDLDDYVDYLRDFLRVLGPQTHVVAVCQPGPPALIATALMAQDDEAAAPATLTLMGSPIDARQSPTEPNKLAESRPLKWFSDRMIQTVPMPHAGVLRRVYPGFVQLASFMNMNWDRHVDAHWSFFQHLVTDDGDSADKHRDFYDEYLSVMDLTEEFYLQTLDRVFQQHLLPRGLYKHRGRLVRPEKITKTALLTVEGENDDISGVGQTQAAHELCSGLPADMKVDHVQSKVGHYGVFNGSRFRNEIQPKVRAFMRAHWDQAMDREARAQAAATAVAAE